MIIKAVSMSHYNFNIDGEYSEWDCVLWYDGPLIYENLEKTQILVPYDYLSQIEILKLIELSNEDYNALVETCSTTKTSNSNCDSIDEILKKMNVVYSFYYLKHGDSEKLMSYSDKLLETNPEIFI